MIALRDESERSNGVAGYRLRIELLGIEPAIWRELAVPFDFTLLDLHDAVQIVMGWEGEHLHLFRLGERTFGDPEALEDDGVEDEDEITVGELFTAVGLELRYLYDFGDDWMHSIRVLEILDEESDVPLLELLGGERAAPPEDCGGIPGYYGLVEALEIFSGPFSGDRMEAYGDYDLEHLDPETVNEALQSYFYEED